VPSAPDTTLLRILCRLLRLWVQMNTAKKYTLGILAFAPLLMMCSIFVAVVYVLENIASLGVDIPRDFDIEDYTAPLWMESEYLKPVMYAIQIGPVLFFCVYAYFYSGVSLEKRILWIVVLIFTNMFALPFFWYFYIYNDADTNT
jgi:hypothetical protein